MLLRHEMDASKSDIEIFVSYPVKNKTVNRILTLIKSFNTQIECYTEDGMKLVNTSDVYYIEAVDRKTISCCEEGNLIIKSSLYQMQENLKNEGFVRVSKYCILNTSKLKMIKPLVNSHMEAVLSNGMCLYVTRKYLSDIRRILQEGT